MKITSILAVCALAFGACGKNETKDNAGKSTSAGQSASDHTEKKTEIAQVTIDELESQMAAQEAPCVAVDANGDMVRAEQGSIPGAILLSNYKKFDASELPANKEGKLVFYCSNEQCGASHAAAEAAMDLGYKNVAVLPAGIMGWVKAGKPVTKPSQGDSEPVEPAVENADGDDTAE